MIVEFIVGLVVVLTMTYFIIRLVDQWKMKRLARKYPAGTETVAKPVTRLDEIPIVKKEEVITKEVITKILKEE